MQKKLGNPTECRSSPSDICQSALKMQQWNIKSVKAGQSQSAIGENNEVSRHKNENFRELKKFFIYLL